MNTQSQFIPTDTGNGTVIGNSYVSMFDNCPRQWFSAYYRPWTEDLSREEPQRGLQPKTWAPSLLTGSLFHTGLEAWYRSGCRDGFDTGERDIDLTIESMESQVSVYRPRYASDEEAAEDLVNCKVLMRAYHDRFGPGAGSPEYPSIQVIHDLSGEPVIEREFRIQLSDRYIYTCRSDLLILHDGYLKTMEHKSSAPGFFAKKRLGTVSYDAQFTGEIAVMRAHLPTLVQDGTPYHGVLLNVLLKGGKTEIALRGTGTRSDAQLERWRLQTIHTLDRIEDSIYRFEQLRLKGLGIDAAADQTFPTLGTRTDRCKAFNRECDYYRLCQLPGMEDRLMGSYRPRTREETTYLRENPQ